MKIMVGHSPDSDDAFMFWGLSSGKVQSKFEFEHVLRDIQTLNEWAREGKLETTAISVHAAAYVTDRYAILRHGGSFGEGYGPMVISKRQVAVDELREVVIAVPGTMTSAYLALNLFFAETFGEGVQPKFEVVPFDAIMPRVQAGEFEAGLIIHEGQLTYQNEGMSLVADLGVWWNETTGLPLPLGVNAVRKDLGQDVMGEISRCMKESIAAGLEERGLALDYALQFARGMDLKTSDRFVGMYVNQRTLDMGEDGEAAIRLMLDRGHQLGLVPTVSLDFVR